MAPAFRIGAASVGPAAGPDGAAALREEAEAAIAELAAAGAGLVVLPETFAMPYVAGDAPERWRHLAEPIDGPTARWAADVAKAHGVAIVFGMALDDGQSSRIRWSPGAPSPLPGGERSIGEAERVRGLKALRISRGPLTRRCAPTSPRRGEVKEGETPRMQLALDDGGPKPFNVALLARPDGSIERLATKIHLPPPAPGDAFGEADHFENGPARVASVALGPIRLAALVCYDRRIAECWRAAAASGADVVAVLVAGEAPDDPDGLFLAELMTHARASAVYVAAAARRGVETVLPTPVRHSGVSAAIDPDGRVLAAATDTTPHVLFDVDPAALVRARARLPRVQRVETLT